MPGSVRDKGKGKWELRWDVATPDGRRRVRSKTVLATGKRDAERKLAALVSAPVKQQTPTLSLMMETWMEKTSPDRSPTTNREYRRLLDKRIAPAIGHLEVGSITPLVIHTYYTLLAGEGLAGSTIRNINAVVSGTLKLAARWDIITSNPCREAGLPKAPKVKVVAPPLPAVKAMIEAAPPEIARFIRLSAATGARRGELLALRWEDLNGTSLRFHRNRVIVDGGTMEKATKTDRERTVSIDATTAAEFEKDRGKPSELIFPPHRPEYYSKWIKRLGAAQGLDLHHHQMRHLHGTQLVAAGVDIRTIAHRLGHASPSITLNVYASAVDERDEAAAAIMEKLLG